MAGRLCPLWHSALAHIIVDGWFIPSNLNGTQQFARHRQLLGYTGGIYWDLLRIFTLAGSCAEGAVPRRGHIACSLPGALGLTVRSRGGHRPLATASQAVGCARCCSLALQLTIWHIHHRRPLRRSRRPSATLRAASCASAVSLCDRSSGYPPAAE